MGVHMWSSTQPSRRGRRMSLEMPHPPIPLTAKDSEFLQRRPELFFPYLQTPFSSAPPMTVSLSIMLSFYFVIQKDRVNPMKKSSLKKSK